MPPRQKLRVSESRGAFSMSHSKAVGHAKTGGFAFAPDQYRFGSVSPGSRTNTPKEETLLWFDRRRIRPSYSPSSGDFAAMELSYLATYTTQRPRDLMMLSPTGLLRFRTMLR